MIPRQPSLKRRLIVKPLIFQLVISLITFGALAALLLRLDSGGSYADEALTKIVAQAVVVTPQGDLEVRMTPELREMHQAAPGLWFVARDGAGRTASFGTVPPQYASLIAALGEVRYAHLRGRPRELTAVIRQETGPAGPLTIIGHGTITTITWTVALFSNMIVVPIFLVLALVTIIATPMIVNRSLAGLKRIAKEAESIDASRRGVRLSEAEVPREIEPLVRAVNDALARLDEDYERQRRFIASAAHELRTPLAVLQVQVEASSPETRQQLSATVARLANLAEQLLDLQRLQHDAPKETIDLTDLARQTAADLAPILIASGKSIEVHANQPLPVCVDRGAIERVLTNLVQNAVEHGGSRVTIRVHERSFEVEDDGPGIPANERDKVFEEFYRLKPRSTGTGLGLNLVRQVIDRHNGRVTIFDAPGGGTIARVEFPG